MADEGMPTCPGMPWKNSEDVVVLMGCINAFTLFRFFAFSLFRNTVQVQLSVIGCRSRRPKADGFVSPGATLLTPSILGT
jgi:hypothetical protein